MARWTGPSSLSAQLAITTKYFIRRPLKRMVLEIFRWVKRHELDISLKAMKLIYKELYTPIRDGEIDRLRGSVKRGNEFFIKTENISKMLLYCPQ
jgi:hypothetical protein